MKKVLTSLLSILFLSFAQGQTNPAITSWLQNNTLFGSYYTSGNSVAQSNGVLANCQEVAYTSSDAYITCSGVPSYPTGPFLDGNPSQAQDQQAIYAIPLNPQANTGTPTATTMGTIGVFINGVALFDYRDGVAWNPNTNSICGGPGNPPCPGGPSAIMDWNRDAIPAEQAGFDCSKGHPAMGTYHHHQNPSAFKLDITVISTICNLYDADGLYNIDSTQHSPLLGFAYDGYPIYGAYGFKNADGTGGVSRIKSAYELRNISQRTHAPDGTDVPDGPDVDATYFLGYFREDYQFVSHNEEDYLDEHNGRFCITPEYPNGTYAYFCTVDEDWVSAYPYGVGPTFYGVYADRLVSSVPAGASVYTSSVGTDSWSLDESSIQVFPNPSSDLIAVQLNGLNREYLHVDLLDASGRLVKQTEIRAGQTIAYFDVQSQYDGLYIVKVYNEKGQKSFKVIIGE